MCDQFDILISSPSPHETARSAKGNPFATNFYVAKPASRSQHSQVLAKKGQEGKAWALCAAGHLVVGRMQLR
jgi:hypothetical protein